MNIRPHYISSASLALFAVFISASAQAQNNAPSRRPALVQFVPYSQAAAKDSVRACHVAIMGEISRPGTYHLDPSELNLNAVVKRAGGFTSGATKSVRVIRKGRLNAQISYSEDSEKSATLLSPGDLLIVDSKQSPDVMGKVTEFEQELTTVRASYEVAAPPAGVQVALLNVLDYPLVVTLPPHQATAGHLIESLGQSMELLANAQVIAPSSRGRNPETHHSLIKLTGNPSIILAGGSAVVFDRGAINRNRLPTTLPLPIESEIAAAAQSGLIGSPKGQSAELRNVGQQMFLSSTNSSGDSSILHPNVSESKPSQQAKPGQSFDEQKYDLPVPTLTMNPKVATLPFTGETPITKSSTGTLNSSSPQIEPIPQPDDAAVEADGTSSPFAPAPSFSLDDPVESPGSRSSIPLAVATLVISGVVISTTLLFRKRWEQQAASRISLPVLPLMNPIVETPEPINSRPPAAKTLLERMIKNELPVTVEPIEFPTDITLQGRIATKLILRVDGPQDLLDGPHFVSSHQDAEEPSLGQVIAQMDAPESMPRRPHFMSKEKQHVAAPVGLTRDHRDTPPSRGGASSNAPLASALFDLERGDHS